MLAVSLECDQLECDLTRNHLPLLPGDGDPGLGGAGQLQPTFGKVTAGEWVHGTRDCLQVPPQQLESSRRPALGLPTPHHLTTATDHTLVFSTSHDTGHQSMRLSILSVMVGRREAPITHLETPVMAPQDQHTTTQFKINETP